MPLTEGMPAGKCSVPPAAPIHDWFHLRSPRHGRRRVKDGQAPFGTRSKRLRKERPRFRRPHLRPSILTFRRPPDLNLTSHEPRRPAVPPAPYPSRRHTRDERSNEQCARDNSLVRARTRRYTIVSQDVIESDTTMAIDLQKTLRSLNSKWIYGRLVRSFHSHLSILSLSQPVYSPIPSSLL